METISGRWVTMSLRDKLIGLKGDRLATVTTSLHPRQIRVLDALAAHYGVSKAQLIRAIIDDGISSVAAEDAQAHELMVRVYEETA